MANTLGQTMRRWFHGGLEQRCEVEQSADCYDPFRSDTVRIGRPDT